VKPEIVSGFPPNIERIRAVLAVGNYTVFTYGATIYAGNNAVETIKKDYPLCCHEGVHTRQQGDDPAGWWERYLVDPRWRLDQEIEAYRVQYQKARKRIHDGKLRKNYLAQIAGFLSSSLYGNVVSQAEAMQLIKHAKLF
jgi:hypothetical protein